MDWMSDRCLEVLHLAEEEVRALQHEYLGATHLLLALILKCPVLLLLLSRRNVTPDEMRQRILDSEQKGPKAVTRKIGRSFRGQAVLELSLREARDQRCSKMNPEHLLIGLLREGSPPRDQSLACKILVETGITLEAVRGAIVLETTAQ